MRTVHFHDLTFRDVAEAVVVDVEQTGKLCGVHLRVVFALEGFHAHALRGAGYGLVFNVRHALPVLLSRSVFACERWHCGALIAQAISPREYDTYRNPVKDLKGILDNGETFPAEAKLTQDQTKGAAEEAKAARRSGQSSEPAKPVAKRSAKRPTQKAKPKVKAASKIETLRTPPSSLDLDRTPSAARSGAKSLEDNQRRQAKLPAALTAGDMDTDAEAAYSSGDEAPVR